MLKEKWVLGNWKMNGRTNLVQNFLTEVSALNIPSHTQVGIAVPHPYLTQAVAQTQDTNLIIGAQNVSQFSEDGAFTGEVSANMLHDVKTKFVLIGHSERRQYFNENNEILEKKLTNTHQANVLPIFCVGEDLNTREQNQENKIIDKQLSILDKFITPDSAIIVAYEPIWAIGTGKVASPEQIEAMHLHIYEQLLSKGANSANIRLLYGGSVNAENASTIFSIMNVDGALVGGASLKIEQFTPIIKATEN